MHQLYLNYYNNINKEEEIMLNDNFNMNYSGLN